MKDKISVIKLTQKERIQLQEFLQQVKDVPVFASTTADVKEILSKAKVVGAED